MQRQQPAKHNQDLRESSPAEMPLLMDLAKELEVQSSWCGCKGGRLEG